jgi:phosphatidylserine/phosphatidylglycerophosphate/cardiolipin synthase-like enzyme
VRALLKGLFLVPLLVLSGWASSLELVQSVPLESDLGQPGVRSTAEVWLELINGARETLDIEQFYVSDGTLEKPGNPAGRESLVPILKAVEAAARRGVVVRLLVDKAFLDTYPVSLERLGKVKNIHTAILDMKRLGGGVQHSKFIIADGQRAYVGSANWDWRALTHIHELGLKVDDEFVGAWIAQLFELDWALCSATDRRQAEAMVPMFPDPFPVVIDRTLVTPVAAPLNLLPTRRLWNGYQILRLIEESSRSLDIQVMTYGLVSRDGAYWDLLDRGLRHAAQRGVHVRLLVSDWSLKETQRPWLESLDVLPGVEVRVSSLPVHSGGESPFARVEHCKYLVADGENTWLGSSNWERDYFHSSRNLGLILEGGSIPAQLTDTFNRSWNGHWTRTLETQL